MPEDVVMMNQTQNGDELIENQSDLPDIVVITCMLSLFSIIGTTGNAFVLYVFSKKKDKNTSTVFILALASIDFVTCILVIPFTIAVEFQFKKIDSDLTYTSEHDSASPGLLS
ncbi:C3a anaphylatoxin chemotactic receptor-like [Mya arenaria]|uniref:C3a anaphylatoxin chemotactic receptor-like n=1 Tax=Mya arenaria TaxID=6604 RepID=UPI0022DF3617|nr:C3a anaphylatoxin chemotactic receptor-like [Mya arenaria]